VDVNVETALSFVTLHSQSIIQWLFLVIVVLVGALVAQALFFKREIAGVGAHGAPADLTEQLNKLIEASARAPHADGSGASASGEHAGDPSHVHHLEAELKAKGEEIAKLKEAVAAAPAAGADEGLDGRLKELEAKLAEYEILEDDIADLSLYKEENQRLKSELESIKASGPAPAASADDGFAPAPVAASAPPAQPDGAPESATARTAEAAAQAAAAAAAFDEPAKPAAQSTAEAADDLFAEFASALEEGGQAPEGNKAG
jgi:hypothetical protein